MKLISLLACMLVLWLTDAGLMPIRLFDSLKDNSLSRISSEESLPIPGTGRISGRVFVAKATASASRSSRGLYGRGVSRLSKAQVDKRAVVFINKVSGRFSPPQSRPVMRQKNVAIVPRVLPVLQGTTVDFPNEDEIFHNIFSLSSTKSFDLGRYSKGNSKAVTFDKTGTVKVFCDIHSQMSGTVLVLQNPYFTVADEDGRFDLSGVPPGNYELSAWHEDSGLSSKRITVSDGDRQSVDFSF